MCRVCGTGPLVVLLDLGEQPLANSLGQGPQPLVRRVPLTLLFCQACSLVQIRETVEKELLFSRYVWLTGTSSSAREFAERFFRMSAEVSGATKDDLVVEVASNDGTFLSPFVRAGYSRTLGVDPAANIAEIANRAGIRTACRFWNEAAGEDVAREHGRAKLIIARNVLAHSSEPEQLLGGMRRCLGDSGVGAVEFHDAGAILRGLQYDSVYHEHLCYFSVRSAAGLFRRCGLTPFHVEASPISGGACVVFVSKTPRPPTAAYEERLRAEEGAGVDALASWRRFGEDCLRHRELSRARVAELAGPVLGFGASARSSTYLNFCAFTAREIEAVIDNNPIKQGLWTPGSAIPIVGLDEGLRRGPASLVVLAWNFKDEILRLCRERGYRGSYLLPFPDEPRRID